MGSALAVAVFVGLAIAVQVTIVGRASSSTHPLTISLALQAAGLGVGVAWGVTQGSLDHVRSIVGQWWWLPLGALGWVIVGALGFASERIGVTTTLAVVVAAQLTAGIVADHLGGTIDLSLRQPAGVALLIAGVILITGR